MPEVTFISTCMGRLEHLQQSLPTWLAQPGCEVVVVDYSCPQQCGTWVEQAHPRAKVVRVPGEAFFNLSRARNAGVQAATGDWLCLVDADVMLAPQFLATVRPLLDSTCFLRADAGASSDLMGTVLIPRAALEAVGGYDEAMQGWGGEDHDLYLRLQRAGLRQTTFPAQLLTPIHHDHESRTAHAVIRNHILGWNVNRLYIEAKTTLWKLMGAPPPLETRTALYALVHRAVTECAHQEEVQIELALGPNPKVTRADVEYKVVLTLKQPLKG